MANVGGIIAGIAVIGAAIWFMGTASAETDDKEPIYGCTDVNAINFNPNANTDDGKCQYPSGESPEEKAEKSEEEDANKVFDEQCGIMWDSEGHRLNNTPKQQGGLLATPKWKRLSCDLNGFETVVFTDKSVYYAGEPVKLIVGKTVFSTDKRNNWHRWNTQQNLHGENLSFRIGITDEVGDSLLEFGKRRGTTISSSKAIELTDNLSSEYPSPGNVDGNDRDFGWVIINVATSELKDITETMNYYIKYKTEIGPYQKGSSCGGGSSQSNHRTFTASTPSFKVLPNVCKTYKSSSSAESYNSEWLASNQSFISGWM